MIGHQPYFSKVVISTNAETHFDGRDFAHVGLGYRYQSESSIYGINAFYDFDLTAKHERASVGAEYANSFMQLNANYYFPISDWQESKKRFSAISAGAIEERPAEGYDINLSAFYPELPWVSIDTSYQQFMGNFVESANGGEPLTKSSILKGAFNYQPIPLLNFSTGYHVEDDREGDALLGMNLNYRFGVPLSKQIDPSEVGASRTIDVQLLDLVKRDHNIRLEYRGQCARCTN